MMGAGRGLLVRSVRVRENADKARTTAVNPIPCHWPEQTYFWKASPGFAILLVFVSTASWARGSALQAMQYTNLQFIPSENNKAKKG